MIVKVASAVVLLFGAVAAPAHAAFPGSNGKLAFARGQAIVSQSASPTATETKLASGFVTAPSYSPNGSKIVYLAGSHLYGPGWFNVWIMNADGTNKRNVTNDLSRYGDPSFSPSGARIIFDEYDGNPLGDRRLHTMSTDGTGRAEFAPDVGGTMTSGVWSPTTSTIAYVGGPSGTMPVLRTISTSGAADSVRSIAPSVTNALHPDWSPNGNQIVFAQSVIPGNKRVIYRVNADMTRLQKLVDYGNDIGADGPVWSPDGTRIAFDKTNYNGGVNPSVWMLTRDGTRTRLDANGYGPTWQPR